MLRHLSTLTLLVLTAGSGLGLACREREPAVGRVQADPTFVHLAYPRFASVRLLFQPLRPLPSLVPQTPPIVFVHLVDREGQVVRTFDRELQRHWREGEPFEDEVVLHQSALAPTLAPGEYSLTVGLLTDGVDRWPLEAPGGGRVARGEYKLATVDVPADDETLPMFYFSNSFLPVERTQDVQHPAVRWFDGEAVLRLAEVAGAGEVYVSLRIPPPELPDATLRVEAGAAEPVVWLTSPCSDQEVRVSGSGQHAIRLRLRPAPAGSQGCEIRLAANFHLVSKVAGVSTRSALVEVLSWSAAS